jgi:predicted dehydrogenase
VGVGVDFEYRAVPLFQQLAALLQQGSIGTPWLVKLDWLMGSRADPRRPWSWYSQRSEGGGVLGALGTHAFDTLHWLIGPTRQLSATCSTAIAERPLARAKGARTGPGPAPLQAWSRPGPRRCRRHCPGAAGAGNRQRPEGCPPR